MNLSLLPDLYYQRLESNLNRMQAKYPDFIPFLSSILEAAQFLEIEADGELLMQVISHYPPQPQVLFSRDSGSVMIQKQAQETQETLQRGVRMMILSGLGVGHGIISGFHLFQKYPRSAIAVCEPNTMAWAAFFSIFDAQPIIECERIFCFFRDRAYQDCLEFIQREYIFLLPPQEIGYILGALPHTPSAADFYISEARNLAKSIHEKTVSFNGVLSRFIAAMSNPLSGAPQSVWSCVSRDAYIHFPLAEAFLKGFSHQDLKIHLEPFDSAFTTNFKVVGKLLENPPDLFFFINTWPTALLEDIGLRRELVESITHPRATWLVDNTAFYEEDNSPMALSPGDWVFYAERTFADWLNRRTERAIFLPAATQFEAPGNFRAELAAPIAYVGSLPPVYSFLYKLPQLAQEILEKVEQLRSRNFTRPFDEHLQSLELTPSLFNKIMTASREFCRTTPKEIKQPNRQLEYFLYNTSTYYKRLRTVQALLPLGLRVFGPETWRNALPEKYRERYGGFISRNDLPDCYASAKIHLNIHSHQCPTCLNTRDFDVPMTGSVVLGDWVADYEKDYLDPGKEILVYHSLEEAGEIIQQMLRSPEELEAIRIQGQQRVRAEHTYTHRAKTVLEILPNTPKTT